MLYDTTIFLLGSLNSPIQFISHLMYTIKIELNNRFIVMDPNNLYNNFII